MNRDGLVNTDDFVEVFMAFGRSLRAPGSSKADIAAVAVVVTAEELALRDIAAWHPELREHTQKVHDVNGAAGGDDKDGINDDGQGGEDLDGVDENEIEDGKDG